MLVEVAEIQLRKETDTATHCTDEHEIAWQYHQGIKVHHFFDLYIFFQYYSNDYELKKAYYFQSGESFCFQERRACKKSHRQTFIYKEDFHWFGLNQVYRRH